MIRKLLSTNGISSKAKKALNNKYLFDLIKKREALGRPYLVSYILNRATSVDWSILDIFYQLCAFKYIRNMFDLAEDGSDEGPMCNLGLLTQYLARYMDDVTPVITASFLENKGFIKSFFSSYTYAIFRLNESEYEDDEVPFPKGRIPFLTIHQAKGLEFPVVILGSCYKREGGADVIEIAMRNLTNKGGEPLDRIKKFDNMRMFYVALSRGENLVILPNFSGRGQRTSEPFKQIFEGGKLPELDQIKVQDLGKSKIDKDDLGKNYSFTGDYLNYLQCPRNYMVFRKYGLVPSRSQTMFFGSLIHQTIEDLHHLLINERNKNK